jgi:uncharacterized protein (DUF305 family)
MKKSIAILILLLTVVSSVAQTRPQTRSQIRKQQRTQERAQTTEQKPTPYEERRARGYTRAWVEVEQGDSVQNIAVLPVYVFRRPADLRKYQRMVIAVKKTYPIAKIARQRMAEMEEKLLTLPTRKAQKAYTRQVEQQIKEEYTPEMLVGKKIIVLANLKPNRICNVNSNGMLLAATNNACGCQVIFVDDCVPEGTAIH